MISSYTGQKKLLFFILVYITPALCNAQGNFLNQKVTIKASNRSINYILKEIEKKTGCNFTFNSNLIDRSININIDARNQKVSTILDQILLPQSLAYKSIDDQIIIYKPQKRTSTPKQTTKSNLPPPTPKKKVVYDTITIINTINDTVVNNIYDTTKIHIYDTIEIKKHKYITKTKIKQKENKWAFYLGYSYGLTKSSFEAINEDYSDLVKNLSKSESIGQTHDLSCIFFNERDKLYLSTGLSLRYSSIKNDYDLKHYFKHKNHEIITDTTFETKLIDTYYEIVDGDSIPYPIYDTTKIINQKEYFRDDSSSISHSGSNESLIISIPIYLNYEIKASDKFQITVSGGMNVSTYIFRKGYSPVISNDTLQLTSLKTESRPQIFTELGFSTLLKYNLNNKNCLAFGLKYRRSISPTYTSEQFYSKDVEQFHVSIGYIFKLY